MDDDFNAPAALAVLFDFTREVNSGLGMEKGPGREDLEAFARLVPGIGRRCAGCAA